MSHKSTQVELLPPGLNIHNSTVSYYLFSSSTNAGISGLEIHLQKSTTQSYSSSSKSFQKLGQQLVVYYIAKAMLAYFLTTGKNFFFLWYVHIFVSVKKVQHEFKFIHHNNFLKKSNNALCNDSFCVILSHEIQFFYISIFFSLQKVFLSKEVY